MAKIHLVDLRFSFEQDASSMTNQYISKKLSSNASLYLILDLPRCIFYLVWFRYSPKPFRILKYHSAYDVCFYLYLFWKKSYWKLLNHPCYKQTMNARIDKQAFIAYIYFSKIKTIRFAIECLLISLVLMRVISKMKIIPKIINKFNDTTTFWYF